MNIKVLVEGHDIELDMQVNVEVFVNDVVTLYHGKFFIKEKLSDTRFLAVKINNMISAYN